MKDSVSIKLRQNKKPLLKSKISDGFEHRFSMKPHGAIQIVWKEGKIVHLHCHKCGNEWKIKDGENYTDFFDVSGDTTLTIKCKKCSIEYKSG